MKRFVFSETSVSGLVLVQRQRLGDARGFLSRLFCAEELAVVGWRGPIAQINHTWTATRGTLRGMHFQYPPHAEMKLVTCLRGEVWDVAVDLRRGAPTFLCSHGVKLSAESGLALLIPQGFAHGFQAVSDDVELLYCHSAAYTSSAEGGLNPLDPRLRISWPLAVTEISPRDANHPPIDDRFEGVKI